MRPYFFLTLAPLLWAGNFVFGKSLFLNLIPVFTPHTCLACVGQASRIGSDRRGLIGDLWRDAGIVRGLEAH